MEVGTDCETNEALFVPPWATAAGAHFELALRSLRESHATKQSYELRVGAKAVESGINFEEAHPH